jgi:signal transduction histidine kinase
MHLRHRSIRVRTSFLVLVPLLSLLGLYVFATVITARAAITLARATAVRSSIADPIGFYATEIQGERTLATVYLAAPTPRDLAALSAQEAKSNAALTVLRRAADSSSTRGASSPAVKAALAATLKDAAGLPALRGQIIANVISRAAAQQAYSRMVAAGYHSIVESILQMPTVPLVNQSLAVMRVAEAEDILLQSEALLVGDDLTRHFPAADHAEFARLVGQYQGMLNEALPDLDSAYRASFRHAVSPQALSALHAVENDVINSPAGTVPRVPLASYDSAARDVAEGLATAGFEAGGTLATSMHQASRPIDLRLILAGGFGLLAIIVSVIVSIWIGRGLVRQLAELRQGALELAHERLPRVMARLSAGEQMDVEAEAPPLATSQDEIGQVREAFNSVQRSAIEAAVGQARLRAGVATVFRNLARRSQSLLHQQLSLLDALERQATEPSELEGLFRIDHLTTRMRRHAEGLVVLAGDQPGRAWTEPVPMADVLRGAVAEVVDYARIRVVCTSRAALEGRAVGDVIHLIAELAENATVFSPPDAPVRILGSQVVHGFAVEIEDRGMGMPEEAMAAFNAAFADPPPLDLTESEQLGLYVAGRLARRHGIRITLRESPFGGTTAIVLIPLDMIVAKEKQPQPSEGGAASPAVSLTGRHASRINGTAPRLPGAPASAPPGSTGNGAGPGTAHAESAHAESAHAESAHAESAHAEAAEAGALSAPVPGPWEIPEWLAGRSDGRGAPAGQPGIPGGSSLTDFELPRRTRQAHLAPQLRDTPPTAAAADSPPAEDERSLDEIRDALTAMQRGWERGRDEDGADVEDRAGQAAPGQDGMTQDGMTQDGMTQDGMTQDGTAQDGTDTGRMPDAGAGQPPPGQPPDPPPAPGSGSGPGS